jgi:methylase of polypeptide subunit release factors
MSRKQIFFLGGPFSAALKTTDGRVSFDDRLKSIIENVLGCFQELGCSVFSSHAAESYGENVDESTLVERDYQWVKDCNVYIALLPLDASGQPYRSDGTFVEIGLALALHKHVFLVIENPSHPSQSYFVRNLGKIGDVHVLDWNSFIETPIAVLRNEIDIIGAEPSPKPLTALREQTTDPDDVLQRLGGQSGVEEVVFKGMRFKVLPGVFSPRYSHAPDFITENWQIPQGASVLDLGCGSGIMGLYALYCGAGSLVAVDSNPRACQNAQLNAVELGFGSKTKVLEGNAYAPLGKDEKFDVIVLTPPYWNKAASNPLEAAFFDEGYRFLSASVSGAAAHLKLSGKVFLGFSDQGDLARLAQLLQQSGLFIRRLLLQRPTMRSGHTRILYELTLP